MAQYNVTNQIKEIAEIKNATIEAIAKELELQLEDGEVIAWNRKEEFRAKNALEDAKKEALRKEAKANFHWQKIDGEWFVAGDFTNHRIGDIITIHKVNGDKQIREIIELTSDGKARVANQ